MTQNEKKLAWKINKISMKTHCKTNVKNYLYQKSLICGITKKYRFRGHIPYTQSKYYSMSFLGYVNIFILHLVRISPLFIYWKLKRVASKGEVKEKVEKEWE